MAIFLTGSTGYIGAHVAANLLEDHGAALNLLVRARDPQDAELRLWRALQLHLDFPRFYEYLQTKVRIFLGDLTATGFGLTRDEYDRLVHTTDSVIHCAASLNRKSEKSCLNVNLRGTLEVLTLARHAEHYHGLRRFSEVSTVAVAGKRSNEVVSEDRSIEWDRSDYDPYARTKKFCEHMMRVLLPDTPKTVFRPSIVLGDSRHAETTQFDMVKAFVFLAGLPALPFRPTDKIDIVNVDFVADAIATLHQKDQPQLRHLSSFFGDRLADFSRVDDGAGCGSAEAWTGLPAVCREAVCRIGELPFQPQGTGRPWCCADESLHAVSGVEHGVRQHARHHRAGPQAGSVFAIQLSAAEIQP